METPVRAGYSQGHAVYTICTELRKLLEASHITLGKSYNFSVPWFPHTPLEAMQAPFSGAVGRNSPIPIDEVLWITFALACLAVSAAVSLGSRICVLQEPPRAFSSYPYSLAQNYDMCPTGLHCSAWPEWFFKSHLGLSGRTLA